LFWVMPIFIVSAAVAAPVRASAATLAASAVRSFI